MDSYIDRLLADMARETDEGRRSEMAARLGCYCARAGEADKAKELLGALRSSGAFIGSARVAIRGMLLESLIAFFGDLDPGGLDRAVRANALASAGDFADLVGLTSAWLAHFYFNADELSRCTAHLTRVLERRQHDPEAQLRGILVFADLNMYCGRLARARSLYEEARQIAVNLRDQASIAAMLYNKAALAMNWSRVSKVSGLEDDIGGAMEFLYSEIDSAKAYHTGARQTSLAQLLDWMLARRELDRGRLASAAEMYRRLIESGNAHSTTSATLAVRIEYAECMIGLGDTGEVIRAVASLNCAHIGRMSFDDELLLEMLKCKANEALDHESPFANRAISRSSAQQKFKLALERVRGAADAVEAALAAQSL